MPNFFIVCNFDNTVRGDKARKIQREILDGKEAITSSLAFIVTPLPSSYTQGLCSTEGVICGLTNNSEVQSSTNNPELVGFEQD